MNRFVAAIALVLVTPSALPRSAFAATPQQALRGAIELYDRGAFEEAERALSAVLPSLRAPRDRATAWLYRGLVHANQKDLAAARASFREALTEDPRVEPDRERVFPAILELFEGARRGVRGRLTVAANEVGARVLIDGKERGRAPIDLELAVGERDVVVRSDDGDRESIPERVLITVRGAAKVVAALVARPGTLQLRIEPRSATVRLDGNILDEAALARGRTAGLPLPAGTHRVQVWAADRLPAEFTVRVRPGGTASVLHTLPPLRPPWYTRKRSWAYVAAATGAAAIVTAVLVGRSATANEDEIRRGERAGTLDQDRYDLLARSAQNNARIANVFYALGGAAAATGIVLFALGDERTPPPTGAGRKEPTSWRLVAAPLRLSFEVRY